MAEVLTNRAVAPHEKADVWLTVAETWFEHEDSVNAERFINKAAHVMHLVQDDKTLLLRYKNFQAKILDSKRKFVLAAWEYYSLSNHEDLDYNTQLTVLKAALTCAILSPAGESKFKILGALHKDERSKQIEPHYDLLEKFYLSHIIKKKECQDFEAEHLNDHQKARGQDGYSVLERSILEHNILVSSKIYLNISFEQIGRFLDIQPDKAENIISEMVSEGRISAQLDQLTHSIEFNAPIESKGVQVAGGQADVQNQMVSADERNLSDYNKQVHAVCSNIDSLISDILKVDPSLSRFDVHNIE
jgi:COP9 signalosome complex subunit 4